MDSIPAEFNTNLSADRLQFKETGTEDNEQS
jgi:hypothetical protein